MRSEEQVLRIVTLLTDDDLNIMLGLIQANITTDDILNVVALNVMTGTQEKDLNNNEQM